jgi:hypothetical protein
VAGVFGHFIEVFFSRPRCALRKARREAMESNIPPMLAAQSDFPSGPLAGFHKIFDQTNLEMILKFLTLLPL